MANRLDFHHHGGFRSFQAFRNRRNLAEQLVEFLGRAGSAVEMQGESKGRRRPRRSPKGIPLQGANRRPRRRLASETPPAALELQRGIMQPRDLPPALRSDDASPHAGRSPETVPS